MANLWRGMFCDYFIHDIKAETEEEAMEEAVKVLIARLQEKEYKPIMWEQHEKH